MEVVVVHKPSNGKVCAHDCTGPSSGRSGCGGKGGTSFAPSPCDQLSVQPSVQDSDQPSVVERDSERVVERKTPYEILRETVSKWRAMIGLLDWGSRRGRPNLWGLAYSNHRSSMGTGFVPHIGPSRRCCIHWAIPRLRRWSGPFIWAERFRPIRYVNGNAQQICWAARPGRKPVRSPILYCGGSTISSLRSKYRRRTRMKWFIFGRLMARDKHGLY